MLNINQLENVDDSGDQIIAACPACREQGGDTKGEHLVIYDDGKFGCAAHQGDNEHRKKIYKLVGKADSQEPADRKECLLKRKEQLEVIIRLDGDRKITTYLREHRQSMLAEYQSDDWRAELINESPVMLGDSGTARHDFIRGLFMPSDILWMSKSRTDTGALDYAKCFCKCSDWLKELKLPPMVAAGTFREGSFSRSLSNVEHSPYIVIEADDLIGHKPTTPEECELNKAYCAALIGYAREHLGLVLRAVLDTGNKSLHAWFDRPSEANFEAIKRMAEGLGIDKSVIENCQAMPLRMPGCPHMKTMTPAQLIYLNPII